MGTLASDLHTLSYEAYLYLYPLVMMDVSRLQATNLPSGSKPGYGAANELHHFREFPPADFRAVVRPNFDTLYSNSWLDLTAGPVLLHVPDTADRYYMLPLLDMWSDVFATVGKRTTGTGAGSFVIVGPGYTGDLPVGLPVIAAPTPFVWVIGRTQTNGPDDYAAVNAVQDGYRLVALTPAAEHAIDPSVDTTTEPLTVVNRMSAVELFGYGARLMMVNPPHATDFSMLARIAHLGIVPGREFDPARFDAGQIRELEAGAIAARQAIMTALPILGTAANGWTMFTNTVGVYGNFYFKRAAVAMSGLGANPVEDAIYPFLATDSDGNPVTGDNDYVLHFGAGELPPVAAFWSVTMYDAQGFQVANEINRFAIGDRDPLVYNSDGSLDIYLQHDRPAAGRDANWLPAPRGALGITMRLYAPAAEALDGRWKPPAARRVEHRK